MKTEKGVGVEWRFCQLNQLHAQWNSFPQPAYAHTDSFHT